MLITQHNSERYSKHGALKLFMRLLEVPSPPGREERLAQVVGSIIDELGFAYEKDGAGNITVRLDGQDPSRGKLLLAAHMDEIGMVVTGIESDGRLKVDRSGGLYPVKIGEGPVDIVGDGKIVSGVLCMGSMHRPDAATHQITWNDVYVATGHSAEVLAGRGVRVGSSIVPSRFRCGPFVFGEEKDPLVAAWTFDDRMGVVTLLRLLEVIRDEKIFPAQPMLVCFTVHEEGGSQGAAVVAQRERPEIFVAIDGCPIPPGVDMKLDGRPGIWSKDRSTNFRSGIDRRFLSRGQGSRDRAAGGGLFRSVFRCQQGLRSGRSRTCGHPRSGEREQSRIRGCSPECFRQSAEDPGAVSKNPGVAEERGGPDYSNIFYWF